MKNSNENKRSFHIAYYYDKKRAEENYMYPNCSTSGRYDSFEDALADAKDSGYPYFNISEIHYLELVGSMWRTKEELLLVAQKTEPKKHYYHCWRDSSCNAQYREVSEEEYRKMKEQGGFQGWFTTNLSEALRWYCD